MRSGRSYLCALTIGGALTFGPAVGFTQTEPPSDASAVSTRASAILASIQGRASNAKSPDAKKCLDEKKNKVNAIKGRAGAADSQSLLAELEAVSGELDSCTGEKKEAGKDGSATGASTVAMTVDEGTPDSETSNPSVVIPPGPVAEGPGVVDESGGGGIGTDVGGDTGGGGGIGSIPVVPPPPVSPLM